jgi:hypothetical protein
VHDRADAGFAALAHEQTQQRPAVAVRKAAVFADLAGPHFYGGIVFGRPVRSSSLPLPRTAVLSPELRGTCAPSSSLGAVGSRGKFLGGRILPLAANV